MRITLISATLMVTIIVAGLTTGIKATPSEAKRSQRVAYTHQAKRDTEHRTRTTQATHRQFWTRALAKVKQQKLAVHLGDHSWAFAGKLSKLGLKKRLRAYKMIANHDRYVIKGSRNKGLPLVMQHHRNELKHALAHIKKIEAKLTPVFSYPWWWYPLGWCESNQNIHYFDGLYEGWINFLNSTWLTYGGGQYAAHAYDATMYEQYIVTMRMHADVPWSQSNPACSAQIGM